MEIIPGVGVAAAKIGDTRAAVEARVGRPLHGPRDARAVYDTKPHLVITYAPEDTVELVELGYARDDRHQVFVDGVALTYRFIDDVVQDLARKGYTCTASDIGYDFHAGFAIFSMGSLSARDLDPDSDEDDERDVVEGVSIAPYSYFCEG
jgi:hypothetical protein